MTELLPWPEFRRVAEAAGFSRAQAWWFYRWYRSEAGRPLPGDG